MTSSKPDKLSTPEKLSYHAELLSNRVAKRFAHLSKKFKKQRIDCFRLYDWDIPEIRAVVDWYAGHLVVGEYVRWQTGDEWLPRMSQAVAEKLKVPKERLHIRKRQTGTQGKPRYAKMGSKGKRFEVQERDLRFWVNLDDFLDTGLFSDHRDTRLIIRDLAKGHDFLNLFAYTGAFTCAAALGGAKTTTTVDRSSTYLDWARDNLELNGFKGPRHKLVRSDTAQFLDKAYRDGNRFTLAFVDPPSFFQDSGDEVSFDINDGHPELIRGVLKVMVPGSTVFFSTNHQRFEPRLETPLVKNLVELTPKTIPEDYRNRKVHRCWKMTAV
jgi:23S rRNA (cytosine1962-C5)-methyltransferase